MKLIALVSLAAMAVLLPGCADEYHELETEAFRAIEQKSLSRQARTDRLRDIRDVARESGLSNAVMLAGLASAETGLAHCWSEARWSCQGPWSSDCNGPVLAGAGDGPCYLEEGGLGLFQFDAGTFDDTLRREGRAVLGLRGNVRNAVEFVADMLVRSHYVSVSSRAAALRWLGSVRPGTGAFEAWIKTVTHYYNGCAPGRCALFWERYGHYAHHARLVHDERATDFWSTGGAGSSSNPEMSRVGSGDLDAIEVWWARAPDGQYTFKAIAPGRVHRIRYLVDGYVIAADVERDDAATAAVDNNFPARYRFSAERERRQLVVEGFDESARLVARGIGLIDVGPGMALYIRQMGKGVYQVGVERPPADLETLSVSANGYQLVDGVTGQIHSPRLAVRSAFSTLGQRRFEIVGHSAQGDELLSATRVFELE